MNEATSVSTDIEANALQDAIMELESALTASDPDIATRFKTVHAKLASRPELVHILTPDQVKVIVSGIDDLARVREATTPKSASKAKVKIDLASLDI